jgi:hypothetical protein
MAGLRERWNAHSAAAGPGLSLRENHGVWRQIAVLAGGLDLCHGEGGGTIPDWRRESIEPSAARQPRREQTPGRFT